MPTEPRDWLKPSEVARMMRVHVNTVKRIPDLPYFKVSDRGDRRYDRHDVESWIESHMSTNEDHVDRV